MDDTSACTCNCSALPCAWVMRFFPILPRGARILDVAAGEGRHTSLFLLEGFRVTAVDVDVSHLEALVGTPGLTLECRDLEAEALRQRIVRRHRRHELPPPRTLSPLLGEPRAGRALPHGNVPALERIHLGAAEESRARLRERRTPSARARRCPHHRVRRGNDVRQPACRTHRVCETRSCRALRLPASRPLTGRRARSKTAGEALPKALSRRPISFAKAFANVSPLRECPAYAAQKAGEV